MPPLVLPELHQILAWILDAARADLDAFQAGHRKLLTQDAIGAFVDVTSERLAHLRQVVGAAERGVELLSRS